MKDILEDKKGSKIIYTLINKTIIPAKSQNKWNGIFENNELDWKTIYKIPAKSKKNTKLHWFQFRILHRILAANDNLFKIGKRKDNICTFYGNSPEKLEHHFWQCNTVTDFWEQTERWIFEKCNYMTNVNIKRALLGMICNKTINNVLNYIMILSRYYIDKCRIKTNV